MICWCCSEEASVGQALCEKASPYFHPAISYSLSSKQLLKYKFSFLCFYNNLGLFPLISWVHWCLKERIRHFCPWPCKGGNGWTQKISQTQGTFAPSLGTSHICCKIQSGNQYIRGVIMPVCNDMYVDLGGGRGKRASKTLKNSFGAIIICVEA